MSSNSDNCFECFTVESVKGRYLFHLDLRRDQARDEPQILPRAFLPQTFDREMPVEHVVGVDAVDVVARQFALRRTALGDLLLQFPLDDPTDTLLAIDLGVGGGT
jgi:hypothetical protein